MITFVTVHVPRDYRIPPVVSYPETTDGRAFVSLSVGSATLLIGPEQAIQIAEELLRALRPDAIIGVVASESETAAALEAARS